MKSLFKLLSFLSIAGIIGLSFFSWYSGDDLCYRNELARYTVFQKAWLQYLHWDGRSLGIASLIQLTGLKYFSAPVLSIVWSLAFIGISFMILQIVESNQSIPASRVTLASTGLLSAILWLGLWKLIPDIIYWPTGGWYCVMCFLGLIWIYVFNYQLRHGRFTAGTYLSIFFVSLICGNNSHNLVIPLLILSIIAFAHSSVIQKNRKAVIYILFAIAGLSVSSFFVMLAPGNMERLKAIAWPGFNRSFLFNCILVTTKYIYWLLALFLSLAFFLWLSGKSFFNALLFSGFKKIFKNKTSFVEFAHTQQYLLAAFSTILVFSATSFFAVPRTAIFFAVFLVIHFLDISKITLNNFNSKMFLHGANAFLLIFIAVLTFEGMKVNALKEKLNARKKNYILYRGNDVAVDAIPVNNIPFAFTFVDITPDSSHWVNRCVALHFNLKTVRTIQN